MNTKPSRRTFLKSCGAGAASLAFLQPAQAKRKKNVLFIAVDDLRPELGCYGNAHIHSPNIDRLAADGILFQRTFCNVPVCGASRASLLTGLRPTKNRFVGYSTKVEEDAPKTLTLPQHFKQNGYYTISIGKVFHHQFDREESWSETPWRPQSLPGEDWRNYLLDEEGHFKGRSTEGFIPATECADVVDSSYYDGKFCERAINKLRSLKDREQPFFLAVGFLKPHLPFNAPKKYWDLYDRDKLPMAENDYPPENAPQSALHNWGELRAYTDIPKKGRLSDEKARELVHGYYACVSYTDALIGELTKELERLGLKDDTVIVLWGDHGWNLREHGLWCKHCNFETSLHAPLIVVDPDHPKGQKTMALTEFVDIYPSLCELCGLEKPEHLQGKSFVPLLKDPQQDWKKEIFSRFHSGDTIRTDRYSYTEWRGKDGKVYANMLYDHSKDPKENVNIADRPENKALVAKLHNTLKKGIQQAASKP